MLHQTFILWIVSFLKHDFVVHERTYALKYFINFILCYLFQNGKKYFLFQITHCGVELGVNKCIILISCKLCSVIRPFTFFYK